MKCPFVVEFMNLMGGFENCWGSYRWTGSCLGFIQFRFNVSCPLLLLGRQENTEELLLRKSRVRCMSCNLFKLCTKLAFKKMWLAVYRASSNTLWLDRELSDMLKFRVLEKANPIWVLMWSSYEQSSACYSAIISFLLNCKLFSNLNAHHSDSF